MPDIAYTGRALMPNELEIRVECAFEGRWYDDADTLDWTDVTGRFREIGSPFSWSRGQSDMLQRTPVPASWSSTVDSADGAFTPGNQASPYWPNVQPGLRLRQSVRNATGLWVQVFDGVVLGLTPSLLKDKPDWTQLDLSAVDPWALFMQAGERRTKRDRVWLDLAAPRVLSWALPAYTAGGAQFEELQVRGVMETAAVEAVGDQQWFFVQARLDSDGAKGWDEAGAAGVLAETGVGTDGGWGGWSSDRFGGALALDAANDFTVTAFVGDAIVTSPNTSRQQVAVGRPPRQFVPVAACDPSSNADVAASWQASAGTLTRVAATSLSWVPRRLSWDPATGATATVVEGPAGATRWVTTGSATLTTAVSARWSVTAGKKYAPQMQVKNASSVSVLWYNAAGAVIQTDILDDTLVGNAVLKGAFPGGLGGKTAPAGAVKVGFQVSVSGAATVDIYSPAFCEAEAIGDYPVTPARWWAPGASDTLRIFGQWRLLDPSAYGLGSAGENVWVHAEIELTGDLADWGTDPRDGLVGNVGPGVDDGGPFPVPVLWIAKGQPGGGVSVGRAAVTWRVSRPASANGWLAAGGPTWLSAGVPAAQSGSLPVSGLQPSNITPYLVITGNAKIPSQAGTAPTDALVQRWFRQYGPPSNALAPVSTTGEAFDRLLDGLNWPVGQRQIDETATAAVLAWPDTPPGENAPVGQSSYSADIANLMTGEYGWAGVTADGKVRFTARDWYDPDGDGVAQAAYVLTWRTADEDLATATPVITYSAPLGQTMGDDNVVNTVTAQTSENSATASFMPDLDSVDRLGVRDQTLTYAQWTQADCDAVAAAVLGMFGEARLLPDSITLTAVGPDDPRLDVILALADGDVVQVVVPQQPADDYVVGAIVQRVAWSTDGQTLTATVSLLPCPADVVTPTRVWTLDPDDPDTLLAPQAQPTVTGDPDTLLVSTSDPNGQVAVHPTDPDTLVITV